MAMETESQKSKKRKAKDKWGKPIFSTVEVTETKGRAEGLRYADKAKKSKNKENKDKSGLSIASADERRNGDGSFKGSREAEDERKSKKNKKARKAEQSQPIVNADGDHEGDDTAEARGEPGEERKSKKRKKGKHDKLGQSTPTAAAKDDNGNDLLDASREPEDQQKLKKKKRKTRKDRWGQPISSAAGGHGDVSAKAVHQPIKRGTERQAAKTHQYEPKKVVVSGMPYSTTEEEIESLFKDIGPVVQMQLSRFPDTGNFSGLAFIRFQSEKVAKKALELDGTKMGKRIVKVERCRQDPRKRSNSELSQEYQKLEGSYSVYVGNLSWEATEDDIRNFFCDTKVEAIRLATNKKTGQFRGFCHVDFADAESLELAISKNQADLHGRQVKVSYADSNRE